MKTEKIYTQHAENNEWMNNVSFYRDEIKIMEGRLQEIAAKNTSNEVLKQVERFQNQFIIQKERLDELEHEINLSNDALGKEIGKNTIALDRRRTEDHALAREEMKAFGEIFTALRSGFNAFLSRWM